MNAREFNMLCTALYGPEYIRRVALLLNRHRRTIQRYKSGAQTVDFADAATLRAMVQHKMPQIRQQGAESGVSA